MLEMVVIAFSIPIIRERNLSYFLSPNASQGLSVRMSVRQRFFVETELYSGRRLVMSREQSHQITHVVRLGQGDELTLFDGRGGEWQATIGSLANKLVEVEVHEFSDSKRQAAVEIVLFLSLLKAQKIEWVVQKATELGVKRIVPLLTARTERLRLPKLERLRRILIEAAEQCGRVDIPIIDQEAKIETVGVSLSIPASSWVGAFDDEAQPMAELVLGTEVREIGLFIGPEGGFTQEEIDMLRSRGVRPISLGALVLRAETAAIAGVAMLLGKYHE
jgi:16S rRNA (uracil1498-N3)-methyltransferase